jgi:hypothetical protein
MADLKERLGSWTKKAGEKLEEIDSQYGLKDKIEGGAKTLVDAAKSGADYIKTPRISPARPPKPPGTPASPFAKRLPTSARRRAALLSIQQNAPQTLSATPLTASARMQNASQRSSGLAQASLQRSIPA